MKKKEEVFVAVKTKKQAKKLKKVLEMFGETISYKPDHTCVNHNYTGSWAYGFSCSSWQGINTRHRYRDTKEVSIQELKNILAREHLVKGDVCLFNDSDGEYFGIFNEVCDHTFKGQFEVSEHLLDGKKQGEGIIKNFIRYATDEEKELFNTNKELEVGKWYKVKFISAIFFLTEIKGDIRKNKGYGIVNDEWYDNRDNAYYMGHAYEVETFEEATAEEVEQALVKEAKRRYKVGDKVTQLDGYYYGSSDDILKIIFDQIEHGRLTGVSRNGFYQCLFKDGKWAEVIKPETEMKTINVTEILLKIGDLEDQIQQLKKLL